MDSTKILLIVDSVLESNKLTSDEKLEIIRAIVDIKYSIDVVKSLGDGRKRDEDGWYLWDAKKERVGAKFVPEHIKGEMIEVRYANGETPFQRGLAENFGFSDDYEEYNVAAYRIIS